MKNAVLIPGSFNPVTKAHVAIGIWVKEHIESLGISPEETEIFYVPSNMTFMEQWKPVERLFDEAERLELLRRAVSPLGFQVLPIEAEGLVDGRTYHTVCYLKERGYDRIFLCFGEDKYSEFPSWYRYRELIQSATILLFPRSPESYRATAGDIAVGPDEGIRLVAAEIPPISSTMVRNALRGRDAEAVRRLVPEPVARLLIPRFCAE